MSRLILAGLALAFALDAIPQEHADAERYAPAACETDSECAELCPEGTRDLPADHPEYCDGGPQPAEDDGSPAWLTLEQARLCSIDAAHCEEGGK